MARRRTRKRSVFDTGGVNLTPLLDVIFNLIFFFVLATNIRERERFLEINLPASSSAQESTAPKEIPEVAIARDGTLYLDGQPKTPAELQAELTTLANRDRMTEVILATDGEVPFQKFTDVTDICRAAGIQVVTPRTRVRGE